MKKKIMTVVVIAGLGLVGLNYAHAGWGGRGAGWNGGYYGNCPQFQGAQYNQVDPATQEKFDKFFDDTQDLRKQIAVKRAEKQALMRSTNPDPAALSKVTGELFDLQSAMRQKAEEAGVTAYMGPRGMGGNGPGMGGPGMRGGRGGRFMGGPMMGPQNF